MSTSPTTLPSSASEHQPNDNTTTIIMHQAISSADDSTPSNSPKEGTSSTTSSKLQQQQQQLNKKKKKKIRPKLKPVSSEDDVRASPGGDDLGFGHYFVPAPPSVSTRDLMGKQQQQQQEQQQQSAAKSKSNAASAAVSDDSSDAALEGNSNSNTTLDTNNMNTNNMNTTTTAGVDADASAIINNNTTTPPPKRTKPRLTAKIQPRSSPFFPSDGLGGGIMGGEYAPPTPDDDDYDAFGFGLVKTTSSKEQGSNRNNTTIGTTTAKHLNSASNSDDHRSSVEDVNSQGSAPSPTKKQQQQQQISPTLSLRRVMSSESYISDDSSSSSSEDELILHHHHDIQRDLMKDDRLENVHVTPHNTNRAAAGQDQEEDELDGIVTDAVIGAAHYSPKRTTTTTTTTTTIMHRQSSSNNARTDSGGSGISSVSMTPSALMEKPTSSLATAEDNVTTTTEDDDGGQEGDSTVHMLNSYRGSSMSDNDIIMEDDGDGDDDDGVTSFSRSSSSSSSEEEEADSSDGELSYFSSQRASPPQSGHLHLPHQLHHHHSQQQQQQSTTSAQISNLHSYPMNSNHLGENSQQQSNYHIPPPLPMRSTSHPPTTASVAAGTAATDMSGNNAQTTTNAIELKLSLSEDFTEGSSMDSDGREGLDDDIIGTGGNRMGLRSPNIKQSTTPYSQGSNSSSADDQVIANELNAYSSYQRKSSSAGSSLNNSISGRHAPMEGHHVSSVLVAPPSTTGTPLDTTPLGTPLGTPTNIHISSSSPVRTFYSTPQSAMLAATTTNNTLLQSTSTSLSTTTTTAKRPLPDRPPGSHYHDSSFLANLREGFLVSSVGSSTRSVVASVDNNASSSFIGSPRGAFGERTLPEEPEREHGKIITIAHDEEEEEEEEEEELAMDIIGRSPQDLSVKTSSTHHTVQSNVQSLAYSDEEDNHHHHRRLGIGKQNYLQGIDEQRANKKKSSHHHVYYAARWIMLLYISVLNLLAGWTCFSVAPFPELAVEALNVDPEYLVVLFLSAHVVGMVFEPLILARLGLRRTVLFGGLLLMAGNMVKSGNLKDVIDQIDDRLWTYCGFVLAGLSQPLYQCTASLLVTSWFPRKEHALVNNLVLYSNPLGIGCAFVLGTLIVKTEDDVLPYFHKLGVITLVMFIGLAMQFNDCPPTPPSGTARIIRGTYERPMFTRGSSSFGNERRPSPKIRRDKASNNKQRKYGKAGDPGASSATVPLLPSTSVENAGVSTAEYNVVAHTITAPSSAFEGPTELVLDQVEPEDAALTTMKPGPISRGVSDNTAQYTLQSYGSTDTTSLAGSQFIGHNNSSSSNNLNNSMVKSTSVSVAERHDDVSAGSSPFPHLRGENNTSTGGGAAAASQSTGSSYYYGISNHQHSFRHHLPPTDYEGVEPIIMQNPRLLDVQVRGNQLWLAIRACFSRKGFSQCVLSFSVSGIVTNVLSTFMCYLVTVNDEAKEGQLYYDNVGIVGGVFQLLIITSSLMSVRCTSRYYMIVIALLALGTLVLALCAANLDDKESLWVNLFMVAAFVAPVRPLSIQLGAEVAYPLSENTVSIIQQLFSNLFSALCIPAFRALREHSVSSPDFSYSFYLLVLIHAIVTIYYFVTFNARYLNLSQRHDEGKQQLIGGSKTQKQQYQQQQHPPASFPKPRAASRKDQPWKKKYPFLIPQNVA